MLIPFSTFFRRFENFGADVLNYTSDTTVIHPLVSIIMPAYNHADYVMEALASVASQTYQNVELIVIDDGSTDTTAQVISDALKDLRRDMRVEFRSQENAGVCITLNRALALAKGTYVQFLASDDVYLPEKTARSVDAFRSYAGDVAAVYSDGYIIDAQSRRQGLFSDQNRVPMGRNVHRELILSNWIPALGILYRRDVLDQLGGFDPNLGYEDWDFLLRLTKTHRIERIPDKLFLYRRHATNMSKDSRIMNATSTALGKKHDEMATFRQLKLAFKKNPVLGMVSSFSNIDLVLRFLSRKIFTNHGIQQVGMLAAILQFTQLAAHGALLRLSAILYVLIGFRFGKRCKFGGRLKAEGNRRNLEIGNDVVFKGDAQFILPRGYGQGRVVIGDGCVISHGALFDCVGGDLTIGPSSFVGRNVVMQSCGDLSIGAGTNISSNVGLYASNYAPTETNDDLSCVRGNMFAGIRIGQHCSIGHGAVIVDGAELGDQSIVNPNVMVRGRYPALTADACDLIATHQEFGQGR
jgi:glycosyltransferase involved in cell wall biosynthesis